MARTITICGHVYSIIDSSTDIYGETKYDLQTIAINPRLTESMQQETLIHEIMHVALFHMNDHQQEDLEPMLNTIANTLYRMGFDPQINNG